jgi:ubiquinone/menaquinone biosynthesis C-methylase UbiE
MANPPNLSFEKFNMAAVKYEALTAGSTRELARYMIEISPPINADSIVLDNACGTGVVAQEVIFARLAAGTAPPKITCTDAAPAMVDIARGICNGIISSHKPHGSANVAADPETITCEVMPGEDLRLSDNSFTHSFTNQGITFFGDAAKGAGEIYRTLKPGGTAVVTTWTAELGHVRVVNDAQKAYKSDTKLMRFPIPEHWYQASHLEKTLRDGGFADVKVHEKTVWYATKTVEEMTGLLHAMFSNFPVGWSESEVAEFEPYLRDAIEKAVVKVTRPVSGSLKGETEELVGVPLVAIVAVAKK